MTPFTRLRGALVPTSLVLAATVLISLVPATSSASGSSDVARLRAANNEFHDISVAEDAGYGLFHDANGIACIADPGAHAAMGVHYVKSALVGDPAEQLTTPEAMVYAPDPDGTLRLAAVEYVVTQQAWHDAGNTMPPMLFGHMFMSMGAANRYGLPPFYSLHVWAWKNNPNGMFSPWNPDVHCPTG
jgi:hypothetical protein